GAALLISDRLTFVRNSKWPLLIASATAIAVLVVLNFFAVPFARHESVRDLLALADASGYANAPVIAQRSDDRSAEFYASGRVIYGPNGEPLTFDEMSVDDARARGDKYVVFIPVEYAEQ